MTETTERPVSLLPGLRITSQIAAGRDGTKFSAVRQSDGAIVEVRVLSGIANHERRKIQLRQRLRQVEMLDHPAAIRILGVQFERNPPVVVLERPDAEQLVDFVDRTSAGDSSTVLELADQIASAVAASHRIGLAHGGLRPAAVFVSPGGQVRIDFSGTEIDPLNTPIPGWPDRTVDTHGAIAGNWSLSDDVYSVAALFAWLLAREVPTSFQALQELVGRVLLARVAGQQGERAIERLCRILDRCLSGEYSDRPTIQKLAGAVRSVLTDADTGCFETQVISVDFDSQGAPSLAPNARDAPLATHRPDEFRQRTTLGRFELREELGEGGMGAVFKAFDPTTDDFVALKIVRPELVRHTRVLDRFHKEARLLAEVQHRNVANLLEVNEDNGVHYLAIEYVPGVDLSEYLARQGPLPEQLAVELTADLLRGLAGAHERNIIHRDIKPANILLRDPGLDPGSETGTEVAASVSDVRTRPEVKLTDFGLARHIDQSQSLQMTQTGMLLGTPHYMAPEQCSGQHELTPATDIYAVGATLFHMLSGRPPFTADDPMVVANMHCHDAPPALAKLRPDISQATAEIVEKALSKDPKSRQSDAQRMLDEIERLLRGEPSNIQVHPILPEHDSAGLFKADFEWDLAASPEQLWPFVSNTERINRAVGVPPVRYESRRDEHRMLRKYADFRMSGLQIAWEELPFEWIEAQRLGVLREFTKGPFKWFLSIVATDRRTDGGTRLRHSVRIAPRGIVGRMVAEFEVNLKGRSRLDQVYRRIDAALSGKLENRPSTDPFEPPTMLPKAAQRRLDERLARLEQQGVGTPTVERLGDYLAHAPPQSVARIRPLAWARQFGVDADDFIECCLRAVNVGLLELHWDIICPSCRISASVQDTLREIRSHSYCEVCDLDFDLDFSSSIEMIFRAHPEIRAVDLQTYCVGGPEHSPHVIAQIRFMPNEQLELEVQLDPGSYVIRGPQLPFSLPLEVQSIQGVSKTNVELAAHAKTEAAPVLRAGRQALAITNHYDRQMLIRIERTVPRQDVVTAAQAAARPLFRELFPHEALDPAQLWSISRMTWLVVDVQNEDRLLAELGDAKTFAILRDFRDTLQKEIEPHGGLIMESSVGRLVRCAFEQPLTALHAALSLAALAWQPTAEKQLQLRAGMHRGAVLVVTVNDRLEYFGQTLNDATRLCRDAAANQVVLSQELSTDPEVSVFLQQAEIPTEIVAIEGQPLARQLRLDSLGSNPRL